MDTEVEQQEDILEELSGDEDEDFLLDSEDEHNDEDNGAEDNEVDSEEEDPLDVLFRDIVGDDYQDSDQVVPGSSAKTTQPEFKWSKETDRDKFTPTVPQFTHTSASFKSTDVLNSRSSPLEIFSNFVDNEMIDEMLLESNRYADSIKSTKPSAMPTWKPIELSELWSFLGLNMLMGLVRKSNIKDYWSTDPLVLTPGFMNTMSRNRFQEISRSLHFSNNDNSPTPRDRLYKLGNFMPKLLKNFQKAISCGEYLCIDESLLLFKGRLSFRQYQPKKRSRFGIKYFALVDNQTKFLVKLIIYLGKGTKIGKQHVKDFGYGGATVITLLEDHFEKNHKVVLDNYFNGPKLLKRLHERKTFGLGTVKKNRKGLPNLSKKLLKGQCEVYHCNGLLLERWGDRREVLMLNTFIEHEMTESTSSNPKNSRTKPNSVLTYNKSMGGVDYIDRELALYKITRKSLKWYKKLAFHLIELAVHNSLVIYNHFWQDKKMSYKEFLLALVHEILEKHKLQRKRTSTVSTFSNTTEMHLPVKKLKPNGKPHNSDCHLCNKNGIRKGTPFACSTCEKRFCIDGTDSCFRKFHTKSSKSGTTSYAKQNQNCAIMRTPVPLVDSQNLSYSQASTYYNPPNSNSSVQAPNYSPITDCSHVSETQESVVGVSDQNQIA